MENKSKKKYTKIGAVLKGDYGPYVILGNTRAKDQKYNYDVQVMVKGADGNKLALVKNPILTLRDPRTITRKDGSTPNVPESVLYELSIVEAENDKE